MSVINIGGENAGDAFYRYKMPKLVAKIEGRGNGIKTNVVNNVDIAKALERPPEYILKFFGCELGAQTNFDKGSGTSIVNGAHDQKRLSELLEGFIKKYVQCYSCGNPETTVKIKKDFIFLKCKACGYVSDVDMRHKLNTFILKNPPEAKMSKEEKRLKKAEQERLEGAADNEKREKKEKKEKEKKKEKDKKKKSKGEGEEANGDSKDGDDEGEDEAEVEDEDEVVWMTDTSEEAMKRRAAEQLTAATAAMVTQGNLEAEAVEARKKAEKEAKKKAAEDAQRRRLALETGDKLDLPNAVLLLQTLDEEGSSQAVGAALKKLNVEGGLAGKMRALFEALLVSDSTTVPAAMKARLELLRSAAGDAQGQLAELVALEALFGDTLPADRMKEAALALKVMYDEDLADEEIIVAWFERADAGKVLGVAPDAARAVRKVVAPVVEWLQEAEEDSEDEDDEE